jgi:capsule polysaccharide export protein KpsE/RkpR
MDDARIRDSTTTTVYEIGANLLRALVGQHSLQYTQIEALMNALNGKVNDMNDQIKALRDKVSADNNQIKAGLANIAADEAGLAQKISDLQAQVAAGQPLTQEDVDNLAAIGTMADDLATATKAVADSVPDAPPAPTT